MRSPSWSRSASPSAWLACPPVCKVCMARHRAKKRANPRGQQLPTGKGAFLPTLGASTRGLSFGRRYTQPFKSSKREALHRAGKTKRVAARAVQRARRRAKREAAARERAAGVVQRCWRKARFRGQFYAWLRGKRAVIWCAPPAVLPWSPQSPLQCDWGRRRALRAHVRVCAVAVSGRVGGSPFEMRSLVWSHGPSAAPCPRVLRQVPGHYAWQNPAAAHPRDSGGSD